MAPAILVPVPLSPGTLLVPRPVATPRPRLLARAGKGSSEEGTSGPGAHRGRSGCARLPESADPRPGLGRAAGGGGSAEGRWKCPLREMGQRGGGTLVEPDAPSSSACLLANLQKNECPPLHLAVSEPLGYPFRLQVARRSPNPKVQVCGAAF